MLPFRRMKPLPKILLALTAVAAVSVACPVSVQAVPTTYTYTGQHFTDASSPYSTSDFASGMLTLAGPLAPNFSGFVTPIAFSFTDGHPTISNPTTTGAAFLFQTGPTGTIEQWLVDILGVGGRIDSNNAFLNVQELGRRDGDGSGSNFDMPGIWATGDLG